MSETLPRDTPRNCTGAPTLNPATLLSKAITQVTGRVNQWRPARTRTAPTARTRAPTMKPPIRVGLTFLVIPGPPSVRGDRLAAGQERPHGGVGRFGEQRLGTAARDDRVPLRIQEHCLVADGEDARQLVRDDHNR